MNTHEDVYNRLCSEYPERSAELYISDDKTLLTLKLGDKLLVTADDDMVVAAKRKTLLGIPYTDAAKHTHYDDFDDLYERLVTYLTADAT